MITRSLPALLAAAFIATAGATPAAADGFSFGFRIGDAGVQFHDRGFGRGFDRPGDWRRDHRYDDRHDDRRGGWHRPGRVVQVCEPVWRKRKIRNEWGEVVRVIRYRTEECRRVVRR